jgi:aqualysin 1
LLKFVFLLVPLFVALTACENVTESPTALPSDDSENGTIITGAYIVEFAADPESGEEVELQTANLLNRAERILGEVSGVVLFGVRDITPLPIINGFVVNDITENVAFALGNHPEVRSIEPDRVIRAANQQTEAPWNLDRIDTPTSTFDGTYRWTLDGSGVTVYVVDSGVNANPHELPRLALGREYITKGVGLNDGQNDCYGHGTQVATVIAGRIHGVAKGATIVPLKVLNCVGMGRTSYVVAALNDVLHSTTGGAVVNLSLGDVGQSWALDASVRALTAANIPVVTAAGNNGGDACSFSPGRERSVINVAAATSADARAVFSNFGSCVSIYAPGENVIVPDSVSKNTRGNGTSYAAAHVTGFVAMLIQSNPNQTPAQLKTRVMNAGSSSVRNHVSGTNKILYVGGRLAAPAAPTSFVCVECATLMSFGGMPTAPWLVSTTSTTEGWGAASGTAYGLVLQVWSREKDAWLHFADSRNVRNAGLPFVRASTPPGLYRWVVVTDSGSVPYASVQFRSSLPLVGGRSVVVSDGNVQGVLRVWADGLRSGVVVERLVGGVWRSVGSGVGFVSVRLSGPVRVRVSPGVGASVLRWSHSFE